MLKSKEILVSDHLLPSSSDERQEDNDEVILKSTSNITPSNTVNIYIPPIKLGVLKASLMDKTTHEYQRMHWDALKKSLNGKINKINKSNFQVIVRELFQDNIKRGRGLLARNIIQAQLVSPFYTPVYTALVSFINTKFSEIGELIVRRLISIFRHTYQRNDKTNCLSTIKFLGHLVNENVLHDRILLQMLVLLLENKTDDRVELAVELIKECEQQLSHVNPSELDLVFATLRNLLHDASLKKRTKYMIEALFAEPKNPIIQPGLDLVDNSYQFTHIITLLGTCAPEIILDTFKYDEKYEENEENYELIQKSMFDETSENGQEIDKTAANLVILRRKIYFIIHTNVNVYECVHRLVKMNLRHEQEIELCQMIVNSCAQRRTYINFFGLLAQRLCSLKKQYVECFERMFQNSYETIAYVEDIKLIKISKFFAHLLAIDAISWSVFGYIRLTNYDTTSSSRLFIKNLFIELSQIVGYVQLNNRLNDASLKCYFQGLLPTDNAKNIEFAIEFFTSIGLGSFTDQLHGCIQ